MHKTASIVFLLLTLIISLVLSGFLQKRAASCLAKAPVAAVVAAKAPVAALKEASGASRSTGTFSPYSGVPLSVIYESAYVSSSPATSDRAFEYLLTPMH